MWANQQIFNIKTHKFVVTLCGQNAAGLYAFLLKIEHSSFSVQPVLTFDSLVSFQLIRGFLNLIREALNLIRGVLNPIKESLIWSESLWSDQRATESDQRGSECLRKRYSENCWPSTPPPFDVFSSNWAFSNAPITCVLKPFIFKVKMNMCLESPLERV